MGITTTLGIMAVALATSAAASRLGAGDEPSERERDFAECAAASDLQGPATLRLPSTHQWLALACAALAALAWTLGALYTVRSRYYVVPAATSLVATVLLVRARTYLVRLDADSFTLARWPARVRRIAWDEIVEVSFRGILAPCTLTLRDRSVVRISTSLLGLPRFAAHVLLRSAGAKMVPATRAALEATARGEVVWPFRLRTPTR